MRDALTYTRRVLNELNSIRFWITFLAARSIGEPHLPENQGEALYRLFAYTHLTWNDLTIPTTGDRVCIQIEVFGQQIVAFWTPFSQQGIGLIRRGMGLDTVKIVKVGMVTKGLGVSSSSREGVNLCGWEICKQEESGVCSSIKIISGSSEGNKVKLIVKRNFSIRASA